MILVDMLIAGSLGRGARRRVRRTQRSLGALSQRPSLLLAVVARSVQRARSPGHDRLDARPPRHGPSWMMTLDGISAPLVALTAFLAVDRGSRVVERRGAARRRTTR